MNVENELLSLVTKAKSNTKEAHVLDEHRFLNYLLLDRIRNEVAPLYEYFGLGGALR